MSEILEPIVLIDYEKGEEAHIVTYTVNTFEEILYAAKRINQDLFNGDWQLSFLDENKQSVALRVQIQPTEKSLTSQEIDEISAKIISEVSSKLTATLR